MLNACIAKLQFDPQPLQKEFTRALGPMPWSLLPLYTPFKPLFTPNRLHPQAVFGIVEAWKKAFSSINSRKDEKRNEENSEQITLRAALCGHAVYAPARVFRAGGNRALLCGGRPYRIRLLPADARGGDRRARRGGGRRAVEKLRVLFRWRLVVRRADDAGRLDALRGLFLRRRKIPRRYLHAVQTLRNRRDALYDGEQQRPI